MHSRDLVAGSKEQHSKSTMKLSKIILTILIVLSVYSMALVISEMAVSRDFARYFFTDIINPPLFDSAITINSDFSKGFFIRFFGVNTTLCMLLLWSSGLLFACLFFISNLKKVKTFALIQMLIFWYLALDERFMIHEFLGIVVKINDAFILLTIGIVELIVLWRWRNVWRKAKYSGTLLSFAAFFFFIMVLIDAFIHSHSLPRLAAEDLSKTWACFCLLFFSVSVFINYIKNGIERNELTK